MICRMIEGLLITIVGGFIVEVLKFIIFRQKEKLYEKVLRSNHTANNRRTETDKTRTNLIS